MRQRQQSLVAVVFGILEFAGSAAFVPSTQPTDYSGLSDQKLSDIIGDFTAPQLPVPNADGTTGVQQLFANSDSSRRINDAIVIVADPATAAAQLQNTKGQLWVEGHRRLAAGCCWLQWRNYFRQFARQVQGGDRPVVHRGQGPRQHGIRRRAQRPNRSRRCTGYRPQARCRDQEPVAELVAGIGSVPSLRSKLRQSLARLHREWFDPKTHRGCRFMTIAEPAAIAILASTIAPA